MMTAYLTMAAFFGLLLCIVIWLAYHGGKVGEIGKTKEAVQKAKALEAANEAFRKENKRREKITYQSRAAMQRGVQLMRDYIIRKKP